MLGNIRTENVHLACGSTDMRKSINGLALIVQESFKEDPFAGTLFVFCNRHRNKIKILCWEPDGFWLYYKRLEKSRFKWPDSSSKKGLQVTERELRWLLDGLSLEQTTAHRPVSQRRLI